MLKILHPKVIFTTLIIINQLLNLSNYFLEPQTRLCEKCNCIRQVNDFVANTLKSDNSICKPCSNLRVTAIDISIYRAILRTIRRDERKRGALGSLAFIIQEDDLRFIIENIWHGHSILSQCDNRHHLRLPRWIISDDWSPWNCVCLTEIEARAHIKLKNLKDVYEEQLIHDIQNKNMLGKSTYKRLNAVNFEESEDQQEIELDEKNI